MSLLEKGKGDSDTDTQREKDLAETEAEFGVMKPQAKEHQELPGAGRGMERFFPRALVECGLTDTLILGFWYPSKWENKFLLFEATRFVVIVIVSREANIEGLH